MFQFVGNLAGITQYPPAKDIAVHTGPVVDEGDGDAVLKSDPVPTTSLIDSPRLLTSASGLSAAHRAKARDLTMKAAYLGLRHSPALHYTQSMRRWDGINLGCKAWRGEYPRYADCSAFATWCLWNGLSHYNVRDVVNGQNWRAGYTGTMVIRGKHVVHSRNMRRADLVIYGDPFGGSGHVAVYIGGGMVISHGSEAGPMKLHWRYRSDVNSVRRFI